MHHILYMSRATAPWSDKDLQALSVKAWQSNDALNVTGVLFYGVGQFAQLLEGERTVVERLYQKISRDPRHAGLIKLADKAIATRRFGTWSMSYEPVTAAGITAAGLVAMAGYHHPVQVPTPPTGLTAADALLYRVICNSVLPRRCNS